MDYQAGLEQAQSFVDQSLRKTSHFIYIILLALGSARPPDLFFVGPSLSVIGITQIILDDLK